MRGRTCFSQRVYAVLLMLYPGALRREFGEEMMQVFTDQMRDAWQRNGWVGGAEVWRLVGCEVLRTVVSSHLQVVGISVVSGLTALGMMLSFFWATFGHR